MTFDQIANTIRKAYPTASEVTITVRADTVQMHLLIETPTSIGDPVKQLDVTVLAATEGKP